MEFYESVVVFRLQDITATCVMLENEREEERWPLPVGIARAYKRRTIIEAFDGEQRSLTSNTLFASDTEMHKLPVKSNLILVDLTQCFAYGTTNAGKWSSCWGNKGTSGFTAIGSLAIIGL